jgi:hypothetical protein
MWYDPEFGRIRRAELDREIELLRLERLLASAGPQHAGMVDRVRRRTGSALIAAGRALGGEVGSLRTWGA